MYIQRDIVATKTQNFLPFEPLSSYKIFRTAVTNINTIMRSCTVANIVAHSNQIWSFSTDHRRSAQYQISLKSAQREPR
jgi:hypothetical protein